MENKPFITITEESYDDMITKYVQAVNRIMDLEMELYELQEELSEVHN